MRGFSKNLVTVVGLVALSTLAASNAHARKKPHSKKGRAAATKSAKSAAKAKAAKQAAAQKAAAAQNEADAPEVSPSTNSRNTAAASNTAAPATGMAGPVQSFAGKSPSGADDGYVARKLKAAIAESGPKLGELEPWQKRILEDEAIPQYQRFVRNYRSAQAHSGTAISSFEVDIDIDALKNYLRFYAPKTLNRDEKTATAMVYLRAEPTCPKCVASEAAIRRIVQMRVARRGLQAVWLSAEDLGVGSDGAGLAGKALNDRLASIAQTRNAAAALVVQWGLAPADDVDSAHADETHYLLQTWFQARGLAGTGKLPASSQNVGTTAAHADLLEVDSFDLSAGKLLADAMVDMGAQAQRAEQQLGSRADPGAAENEINVEISGVRDFAQYTKLKNQVQARLSNTVVEERKLARGKATLAVMGSKAPIEAVRAQLSGLQLDPGTPGGGKLAANEGASSSASAGPDSPPTLFMEIR